MTATVESLAETIAAGPGRHWLFSPSPAPGVLDFVVDERVFRIIVLDEAQDIEGVVVYRSQDVTEEEVEAFTAAMTEAEAEQVAKAQAIAAAAEAHAPTQEELEDIASGLAEEGLA